MGFSLIIFEIRHLRPFLRTQNPISAYLSVPNTTLTFSRGHLRNAPIDSAKQLRAALTGRTNSLHLLAFPPQLKYNINIPTKCVSISCMDCLWDGETANEGAGLPRATANYCHLAPGLLSARPA